MTVHILQSHNPNAVTPWIQACLQSVRNWAADQGYDYQFIGDELLAALPDDLKRKTASQPVVSSDLGRLIWLQQRLDEGAETAVWLDADTWIFNPAEFHLPAANAAVGRECWIQADGRRWRCYRKVHNAALMFRTDNSLLPFYRETAERLLRAHAGTRVVPQLIGPKLLTALHSACQLPVWEQAGVFSPAVIADLMRGGGAALQLLLKRGAPPAAANLCQSSVARGELQADTLSRLIQDAPAVRQCLSQAAAGTADTGFRHKRARTQDPA